MHRFARRGLVIATAAALLAATACTSKSNTPGGETPGPGDRTGVTTGEILIGTHQPLTGAAAPSYGKIAFATKAYFEYVNEHGGVNGRKIKYEILDDGYNPTNTASVVSRLIEKDKVFAILNGLGTPTHTSVLDTIKEAKIPDLFVASGSVNWNNPGKYSTTFGFQTDYITDYKILGNYVKTNFAGKKVCFLGQNDDFGANSLTGLQAGLGSGIPITAQDQYAVGAPTLAAQITKFKTAGCEVVVTATITTYTGIAIATGASLAFMPQWITSGTGGDYTTLVNGQALKGHPELANGLISSGYGPLVSDTANPWVAGFKTISQQYNKDNPFDGNAFYGMSVGYLFVQSLLAAGKDLTREGLVAAVEKNGFVGGGFVPLGYSKTNHGGYTGVKLAQIKNNVQAYFGNAYVTDIKDGPVTEYTGSPATPPADMIPKAA